MAKAPKTPLKGNRSKKEGSPKSDTTEITVAASIVGIDSVDSTEFELKQSSSESSEIWGEVAQPEEDSLPADTLVGVGKVETSMISLIAEGIHVEVDLGVWESVSL